MLVPQAKLTIENRLYEEQILAVRLRRCRLPGIDRLEVAFPLHTTFDAGPGDECSLTLDGGDQDGGGGEAVVFTGQVTQVKRLGTSSRLTAHNGGRALAQYRPVAAFEKIELGKVIEGYCADVGTACIVDIAAPVLPLYATNGHATAQQEIARLAGLANGAGSFDGAGRLHVTGNGGPDEELALRYGRELLQIDIAEGQQPEAPITIVGEGAGDPQAPEARWLTTDFLAGSAAAPVVSARRRSEPELRDSTDTEAAAAGLASRRSAAARPIRLHTWMMPRLAPGMRLEIADLPDPLSLDECRVAQTVSTLSQGGQAGTEIWAEGKPPEGGLLALIGGLI